MIKFVSFDLDGTLADDSFDKTVWNEKIPEAYAKKNSLPITEAKKDVYAQYYRALYVEKVNSWTDVEYWFNRLGLENWKGLIAKMKREVFVFPDARETLEYLKDKYELVVLSNSEEKFLNFKLQAEGLADFFSHIISAPSRFGITKQNTRAYQKMLKVLKASAQEVVHVGDDLEMDYATARAAGLKAFHLRRGSPPENDDQIRELIDLKWKL